MSEFSHSKVTESLETISKNEDIVKFKPSENFNLKDNEISFGKIIDHYILECMQKFEEKITVYNEKENERSKRNVEDDLQPSNTYDSSAIKKNMKPKYKSGYM